MFPRQVAFHCHPNYIDPVKDKSIVHIWNIKLEKYIYTKSEKKSITQYVWKLNECSTLYIFSQEIIMSTYVFRFSMSKIKILEILVVLVDDEYVEVIKRSMRIYRLRKENFSMNFEVTNINQCSAKITFYSLSLKGSL